MTDTLVLSAGTGTDKHKKLVTPDDQAKKAPKKVDRAWVERRIQAAIPTIALNLNDALDDVIAEQGGDEVIMEAIRPAAATNYAAIGTMGKIRKLVMECIGVFLVAEAMMHLIETRDNVVVNQDEITGIVRALLDTAMKDKGQTLVGQLDNFRNQGTERTREYDAKLQDMD